MAPNAFHADVLPDLIELREDGLTLAEIAETMNDRNQFQRNGKPWNAVQVSRVLAKVWTLRHPAGYGDALHLKNSGTPGFEQRRSRVD